MMNRMPPLVIAIDGPAGAGKSTTAREVAKRLGLRWIDTGAMYRAVTIFLLRNNVHPVEGAVLARTLDRIRIELQLVDGRQRVLLEGEDVTESIRDPEVSRHVSRVAELPQVREALVRLQREAATHGNAVMEGRDIGTIVFPDAPVKIFLSASLEERAKRRSRELIERDTSVDLEELKEEIHQRDTADSNRECSPLRPAEDAILLDSTNMTFEEQVTAIVELVHKRGYHKPS